MPRQQRSNCESGVYHVMARGVGRCIIFEDDRDRTTFVQYLERFVCNAGLSLNAWCLMDNHYHLLVNCNGKEIGSLSQAMQKLNATFAMYFNRRHERVGHLFQDRFRSVPINSDEQLLTVVRYIHQNPVKDNVSATCSYPWSSFDGYLDSPWLVDNEPIASLLPSKAAFEEFHNGIDDDGVETAAACLRAAHSDDLLRTAREALGDVRLEDIAGMSRAERNDALRKLKETGFSLRQIERMTGVPKSVVARA